ncbi:hypothetical protein AR457_30695 [Streptomyces agglomeratus]|uniref:Uncharacterized protein n=1 Tax=Streptomyces agglomeratus TaxID=285458 RepID=A0A1E5PF83_9ACTN|nr:hypothetical protein [Streptomyces agglomeratus]OEJ28191.1 hypothetical protein AS594_30585 [Streptomyces agglomeratus]OEJ37743.1 hypothetical protein BGK70_05950 [Streptomyces agglomeratus]OEJ47870.1 hypothetical protein AR457_30695 [Streptomyces agglomeratus]OEJ50281.1 hypothetical protein BGK72_05470 [Streptomyces agglomeratus]OEJ57608.1 hypothetical protein BGM19_06155 [Streptomyces agglomeratus]
MAEPEFTATGVRIGRWPRSLTKAGQVLVQDGRLVLLTSNGREIDSAPLGAVTAARPWFAGDDSTVATVNGTRYRLTMGQGGQAKEGEQLAGRFLETVRAAHDAYGLPGVQDSRD